MSNEIAADYSLVYLLPPSIEDFIGAEDPARFIRSFVDSLDLGDMGFKVRTSSDGRPSYAVSLLLKVWLYGTFEHIGSSRTLERRCKRDLGLLWLTGMHYPDHNTLWRFFRDNREAIKTLFKQSVAVALKNDMIGMVYHALDGTKIAANASRFKRMTQEEMKEVLKHVEAHVEALSTEIAQRGAEEVDDSLPAKLRDARELEKAVTESVAALEGKGNGTMSPIDPASRKMPMREGGVAFGYNAQAMADEKNGIIVGAMVSQEETDHHLLGRMITETKETMGQVARRTVADAGYFSGKEIAAVEGGATGSDVYVAIPLEHNRGSVPTSADPYHSSHFTYREIDDVFLCQHGGVLKRTGKYNDYVRYTCGSFSGCLHASSCTTSRRQKQLCMHQNHAAIHRHKQKITTTLGRALLSKRRAIIERVFGWIKEYYGLRRFRVRGVTKASAVWYWVCTVYNLKKIWACTNGDACFS
jgi:transposase